jgi:quercetin dioxygenase-like cupin family protein
MPDRIVPPMTGERIVFRQRARQMGGVLLLADNFVTPRGAIRPHIHPHMEELFEVLQGPITLRVDGVETTHGTGDGA